MLQILNTIKALPFWPQISQACQWYQRCVVCQLYEADSLGICIKCLPTLPWLSTDFQDDEPFSHFPPPKKIQTLGPQSDVYALMAYAQPVDKFVTRLKFRGDLFYGALIGRLMLRAYQQLSVRPDVMLPVPLHAKRQRQRGFNQTIEIAKPICKKLSVPLNVTAVARVRHTKAQAKLSLRSRKSNVRQAFLSRNSFVGKHVVVIEDVITTGNTLRELVSCLVMSGAKRVDVWCYCKAI